MDIILKKDVSEPVVYTYDENTFDRLEKELKVLSFAPDLRAWKPEDVMVRGVPLGLEDRIEQIVLEITPEYRIARILIHGVDDSVTEYRFSNQKENVAVADKQFRFTAPAGTEVIEEEGGGHWATSYELAKCRGGEFRGSRHRFKGYRPAGLWRYARYTSVLSSCKNSVFQC